MRNQLTRILIFVTLILFSQAVFSQSHRNKVRALRKQRKEIQHLINLTDKQLRQTKQKEQHTLKRINTLQANLTDRKELINNYNKEINLVEEKINQLEKEKKQLEFQLKQLKKDYKQLIQSTQIQKGPYAKLQFFLSAETFNQSWRRLRYLKEFAEYRKEQLAEIKAVQETLNAKSDTLNTNRQGIEQLLEAKRLEHTKLEFAQKKEKKCLVTIRKQGKKLSKEFQKQVLKRGQIDKKIENVIREEIQKAEQRKRRLAEKRRKETIRKKKRSRKSSKNIAPSSSQKQRVDNRINRKTITYSTNDTRLSGNFAKKRGRLPWPVSRGYISKRFGKHRHPTFRHVTINNKGTYFKSPKGATAKAIFEGVVTRRFSLPGSGNAVIIQHGKYRTVYANLTNIYVKVGDRVKGNQAIGAIYVDEEKGYAELLFQIWKRTSLENPERWIRR